MWFLAYIMHICIFMQFLLSRGNEEFWERNMFYFGGKSGNRMAQKSVTMAERFARNGDHRTSEKDQCLILDGVAV